MASSSKFTYTDLQNPLFLHPSDGPTSMSVSKLQGPVDYRAWRRQFEIQLSAKIKFDFVNDSISRSTSDATEAAQWDTCNNMAIAIVKEEARLFQFLNGLDDTYGAQRSQLLMSVPLPSVEMACAVIQQEESQRDLLNQSVAFDGDVAAMYSKGNGDRFFGDRSLTCTACGYRGHSQERCWTVTGYPKWHHKYRKPGQKFNSQQGKWSGTQKAFSPKAANHVQGSVSEQSDLKITPQQLEQLMQLLPKCVVQKGSETDEELDFGFSGMVNVNIVKAPKSEWIMESGASDHMVSSLENMINVKAAPSSLL
ncbi:uncharacterized protein LOC141671522 [Apium graveolens]|uniref:uncharacterized protein LOC141671522 n=1 Tax=Apium graveolens TaxID=4045 RepID=UPI003D7A543B